MSVLDYWPTETVVRECMPPQADDAPDSLFMALHQTMSIKKVLFAQTTGNRGSNTGEAVTEEALLKHFLEPQPASGALVVPVVGETGSGKSHLIRWLNTALMELDPKEEKRLVIWIRKNCSLREVMELILEKLPGPQYDLARKKLRGATERMNTSDLAQHLRAGLLVQLDRQHAILTREMRDSRLRGEKVPPGMALRESLTHPATCLPAILDDPITQARFLGPDGVLTRLVRGILENGIRQEAQRPSHFVRDDLGFAGINMAEASLPARGAVSQLRDEKILGTAVDLLNESIDPAINALAQLGDNTLRKILLDVRSHLLDDGRELVLLIEDFARMTGIQNDLLEAMIEAGEIRGEWKYCTMRTAFAVTSGMMLNRQTVASRAVYEWALEDRPVSVLDGVSQSDYIERQILNLAGAYLNAARMGRLTVEESYQQSLGNLRDWPPRFTPDTAADAAALAAFGTDSFGHELFPFNRCALLRLVRERYADSQGQLIFRPRHLINLLWEVLLENRDLAERGQFPPGQWNGHEALDAEVEVFVRDNSPSGARWRILSCLHYWGDHPGTLNEAVVVDASLFGAFGLAWPPPRPPGRCEKCDHEQHSPGRCAIADCKCPDIPPPPPVKCEKCDHEQHDPGRGANPDSRRPHTPPPPSVVKWERTLTAWRSGTLLAPTDARELRNMARDALFEYLDLTSESLRVATEPAYYSRWVYVPNAGGGDPTATDQHCLFALCSDADYADPDRRLDASLSLLALVKCRTPRGALDGCDPKEICLYASLVEGLVPQAVRFLREHPFGTRTDSKRTVEALVQRLVVGSQILGVTGASADDDAQVIDAMFAPGDTSGECLTPEWSETRKKWGAAGPQEQTRQDDRGNTQKDLLLQVGARRGDGDVEAVNPVPLLAAIRTMRTEMAKSVGTTTFPALSGYTADQTRAGINAEWRAMQDWEEKIHAFLGDALSWGDCLSLVRETVGKARTLAVYQNRDVDSRAFLDRMKKLPTGIAGLREACLVPDSTSRILSAIHDFVSASAVRVGAFILDTTSFHTETVAYLTGRIRGGPDTPDLGTLEEGTRAAMATLQKMIGEAGKTALPRVAPEFDTEAVPAAVGTPTGPCQPPPSASAPSDFPQTVKQRCDEMDALLAEHKRREKIRTEIETLRERRKELDGEVENWEKATARRRSYGNRGVLGLRGYQVDVLLGRLEGLRDKFEADPTSLNQGQDLPRFLRLSGALLKELNADLDKGWQDYAVAQMPPFTGGIVRALAKLQTCMAVAERLLQVLDQLDCLRRVPATDEESVNYFDASVLEANQLQEQLPLADLPTGVATFFEQLSRDESVPVALLTDEVVTWLSGTGLLTEFAVTTRQTPKPDLPEARICR